MAISLLEERLVSFAKAARRTPRRRQGRPVHSSTLWRWHRRGVKCGDGRIFLEAVKLPSGMATSLEALQRFVDRLNEAPAKSEAVTAPNDAEMTTAIEELDRDGV
jgi:hypothetical protein